jgi:hypothetical protein
LLAAGLMPKPTWADAGSPSFLSAAARPDGTFVLCGIDSNAQVRFEIPLPDRGHAAAAHPHRPEAVAFARRPGTFAIVLDCRSGNRTATLSAPDGRHFYGHGAYSADGDVLFTTENDFAAGQGRIGVWDATNGYKRVDEWHSGGIGPHDVKRLPGTDTLVVANGGIDTHPDSGRTKLNIPTMKPNLAYIRDGAVIETASLSGAMHKNSIRHLAVGEDGIVAFGMQWQGDGPTHALIGTHKIGQNTNLFELSHDQVRRTDGYIGSVALSRNAQTIAATSPRGGLLQLYDVQTQQLSKVVAFEDVCGTAPLLNGFLLTSGTGQMQSADIAGQDINRNGGLAWDNHLVQI